METESLPINAENFNQLLCDVALIKEMLIANQTDFEGEPTDWVKNELAEARQIPNSENISLEELEEQIIVK